MKSARLEDLLAELQDLTREAGAASLAEHIERELQGGEALVPAPQRTALFVMVETALRAGLDARKKSAELTSAEVEARLERLREAPPVSGDAVAFFEQEIRRTGQRIRADVAQFKRDLELELPAAVRDASASDIKKHFPAFVERTFGVWLEAEIDEIERELAELLERTSSLREDNPAALRPSLLPELPGRALDVDSFPRDFGVFALSALGLAVLFSNALLGGALLLLAPVAARYGKERSLVDLRRQAGEEATRALSAAADALEAELVRRVDAFGAETLALALAPSAPVRRSVAEMLARALAERSAEPERAASVELGRCQGWQERAAELVARLHGIGPGQR